MLRLSWLISIGISLFGFMITEHFFTVKADETATVGGNLGALGIALVLPFLLLSMVTTFRYFTEQLRSTKDSVIRTFLLMLGVGLTAVFIYYAVQYKNDVYAQLGGTTINTESIIYGYPVLNEYTNKIFMNFYTFGALHTILALAGSLYGMLKPAPVVEEDTQTNGLS